jgi:hypothetical protein
MINQHSPFPVPVPRPLLLIPPSAATRPLVFFVLVEFVVQLFEFVFEIVVFVLVEIVVIVEVVFVFIVFVVEIVVVVEVVLVIEVYLVIEVVFVFQIIIQRLIVEIVIIAAASR